LPFADVEILAYPFVRAGRISSIRDNIKMLIELSSAIRIFIYLTSSFLAGLGLLFSELLLLEVKFGC
jgi:hypothetical protein